ncbi:MAG: CapA family protein [Acetatifactor sp.]|nr:CapA family protein [Acetatifactor sp.]
MRKNKTVFTAGLLLGALLLFPGCGTADTGTDAMSSASAAIQGQPIVTPVPIESTAESLESTPEPTATPTPTPEPELTLMALGDNLMHMGIVNTGKQKDGTRNYDFLFEDLHDFIDLADVSVINQETIFGGNDLGFSGYPYFNSPTEVGDAIVNAGFDVVLQATNHTLDQKQEGVQHCMDFWAQYPEILMVGLHERYETEDGTLLPAKERIPTIEKNGITLAILNYTYGPNYEILPGYARGRMDVLCNYDQKSGRLDFTTINPQVLEEIAAAKEIADAVVVFPHWGAEYVTTPTKYQKQFAKQMTEAGADLIIGAHPHVTQPVQWITADNGNECLCYYSLGNYVSTQQDPISMLENMAWVTFRKTENGTIIDREKSGSIPLVFQYYSGPLRFGGVYLLEEYTQELANMHGIRNWGKKNLYVDELWEWAFEILGDSVKSAYDLTGLREPDELEPAG